MKGKAMNIFILDRDPVQAARYTIDKHCSKMVLESAQLLCAAFPVGSAPYRRTHYNHPCSVWVRESRSNFEWLVDHAMGLADEFILRYGKDHKSEEVIRWCSKHMAEADLPDVNLTPFAQAMPDQYRRADPVEAYRAYYQGAKAEIATWKPIRGRPDWWSV